MSLWYVMYVVYGVTLTNNTNDPKYDQYVQYDVTYCSRGSVYSYDCGQDVY